MSNNEQKTRGAEISLQPPREAVKQTNPTGCDTRGTFSLSTYDTKLPQAFIAIPKYSDPTKKAPSSPKEHVNFLAIDNNTLHCCNNCGHAMNNESPAKSTTESKNNKVITINNNDVLYGRGGETNKHDGNIRYRSLVKKYQLAYLQTRKKKEKTRISRLIVDTVRQSNPAGRFLKKNEDGVWYEVDISKAMAKTSQALREDAPFIRRETKNVQGGHSFGAIPYGMKNDGVFSACKVRMKYKLNDKVEQVGMMQPHTINNFPLGWRFDRPMY